MPGVPLHLPAALHAALWQHARSDPHHEVVGALGGVLHGETWFVHTLYPLPNIAPDPTREYLADPTYLLRALKAMRAESLDLVGLYHSHPRGPDRPSRTDTQLAAYDVPYLIADLRSGTLRAYLLPEAQEVALHVTDGPE
ncbi:Mov34/MPN/PAD-1 family protein [Deinococcus xianganensis]|uniref:JAB1/MPN/MOV34 metalloenzyme domain-containing protein n=1 Tax=Deinococcus xianganensis TaxID=1507289 RepID=A0A6I4YAX5_9DEIO|nr:M67 family metallopeptidase [Deinococcus xianganensis]MXV18542.1 hypothetical protein [Deinococcus xianganensis]